MQKGIINGIPITLHEDTLGVTSAALKAVRNEMAQRFKHLITICQVPNSDDLNGYGIVIFDHSAHEAVVIGDGFSRDGGGEGGAGHRALMAFLMVLGIAPVMLLDTEAITFSGGIAHYEQVIDAARIYEPRLPLMALTPQYIDTVLRYLDPA